MATEPPVVPPASGQPPTPVVPPEPPPATPAPAPPAPTPPPATPPPTPPPASKAPAAYDLKVPDASKPLIADEDLTYLQEVARANDWTNEEAQAELTATIARVEQRLTKQAEQFLSDTKADKEYGGAKLEESQTLARAAITRLRPEGHPRREAFLRFINQGGAGNHIEVVAFLADLGKLMAEDTSRGGGSGGGAEKTIAEILYDKT